MKILVVGGHAPALIGFRGPFLKALVDRGHKVVAVADAAAPELAQKIETLGVRFRPIPVERNIVTVGGDLRLIGALTQLMREEAPDLFFGYMHKPIIYGTIAAVRAGVRRRVAMVTGLGYPWEAETPRHRVFRLLLSAMYRLAFRYNDAVIFHNRDDRDIMLKAGLLLARKAHVVNGSGLDLSLFPQKPLPAGKPLRFLMIARLVASKGLPEYVAAARLIKREFPDVIFDLVGPVDPHPGAISLGQVRAWHEEGVIQHHGEQRDVRPFLEACSVYVLPSHAEGTPRSVLEAMSTGRSILTTDTRGCRETVKDGVNGFLTPPRDVTALADAMKCLIRSPDLIAQMAQKSRRYVQEKYEVGSVNADMLRIIGA